MRGAWNCNDGKKTVNVGIDFDFMRGKAGVGLLLGLRGLSMLVDQPTLLSNITFNEKCKIVVSRRGHGGRNSVLINFHCGMAAVVICNDA